ncbi:peptidase inhibitor family I36 protein [Streptomyces sp. NPDC048483]|uniref:peptidase inhibitor family I36 protein n=1 Tax=Streptomyces sp. NPDC048483 TaxID=3154927 RepID=UPI003446A6AB
MRIRNIVAAGAAAAALSLGVALPAFADGHAPVAADQAAAAKRKVVVFQDAKYKNRSTTFTKNIPKLSKYGWNDTISSAKNKGNRTVTFYQHKNYVGASFPLAPGEKEPHFGDHSNMSDATSSIKFS